MSGKRNQNHVVTATLIPGRKTDVESNVVTTLVFGRSNDVGNTTWQRCDNIQRRDQNTTKTCVCVGACVGVCVCVCLSASQSVCLLVCLSMCMYVRVCFHYIRNENEKHLTEHAHYFKLNEGLGLQVLWFPFVALKKKCAIVSVIGFSHPRCGSRQLKAREIDFEEHVNIPATLL